MRWPLYIAQVATSSAAIVLVVVALQRCWRNCSELSILLPWLIIKLGFGLNLCYQAWRAGGDIPLYVANVFWSNVLLFVGPLSFCFMVSARLWNGSRR